MHYSDLTGAEKAELMKPATDAAKTVTDKMAQIEQDANLKIADLTTFETTAKEQEADRVDAEKKRKAEEGIRKTDEATRKSDFEKLKTDAGEATSNANTSAANADEKAKEAERQTGLAGAAAKNANDAAADAVKAKENADNATKSANDAAGAANGAAELANTAAGKANTAAGLAEEKAGLANDAAADAVKAKENADNATKSANDAAGAANGAAELANTAAGKANTAACLAEEKAGLANTATELAKSAASAAQEMADKQPIFDIYGNVYFWDRTLKDYVKSDINLMGKPFSIAETYPSVEAMKADADNEKIPLGSFVAVSIPIPDVPEGSDTEEPDTAKLYIKNEHDGVISFNFIVDMSGARGFTGKTPQISIGLVTKDENPSASLSPNGTDPNGNPKFLLNLVLTEGG